jgi:heat shock protein HslJ
MRRTISQSLLVALLVTACGGSEQGAETTAPEVDEGTPAADTTTPTLAATSTEAESSVEAPELGATSWNVTDYRLPDGGITNVWKTEVTISFSADGTVSGSAGCNDYTGTWDVSGGWNEFEDGVPDPEDGQVLILASLSWTEVACEDPAIMEQETEILDLLQDAGRWVLIRGNFNLRDTEGSFLFEAEPA